MVLLCSSFGKVRAILEVSSIVVVLFTSDDKTHELMRNTTKALYVFEFHNGSSTDHIENKSVEIIERVQVGFSAQLTTLICVFHQKTC